MSLQPAPRLHIMRLLTPRGPCALRYLSLILSLLVLLVTAFHRRSRALFSTLILFVLSMLYTAEVTSERNVLLPGVPGRDLPPFLPVALCLPLGYATCSLLSTRTCILREIIFFFFIRFEVVRMVIMQTTHRTRSNAN